MACGVKTPPVVPEEDVAGVKQLKVEIVEKMVKLTWIKVKENVDAFKIFRQKAKPKEICPGCPLNLKEVDIVKTKDKMMWFDHEVEPGYYYWYKVCPVYKGKVGGCSQVSQVFIK